VTWRRTPFGLVATVYPSGLSIPGGSTMAERRDIHILPNGDGWAVKRENQDRPLSTHRTQAEATEAGRSVAQDDEGELLVHGQDGQIRDRSTYGHDPRDIPG
jgi:Uncharacterized protein conserved in bacteria (DUF2188)